MKKMPFAMLLLGLSSAFWFTGCDKSSSTEPSVSDKDALSSIIADDALFSADNVLLNDGDPTTTSAMYSLAKTSTAIIPHNWGRKIESFSRTIDFAAITDTTAQATVTHTMTGFLWIRGKYSTSDTAVTTVKKPFTETTTRIARFVRIARSDNPKRNWKISELSAVKGGTAGSGITINEIRFYAGDDTVIVTDPNNTFLKFAKGRGKFVPELSVDPNTPLRVQVTVTSTSPDSDFVTAHRPFWYMNKWIYRAPMLLVSSNANGDGTFIRVYEHSWRGVWMGRHNLLVSALTRSSIFDDAANVSSQIWGVPFISL